MKTLIHQHGNRHDPREQAMSLEDDAWGRVASIANVHILVDALTNNVDVQQWLLRRDIQGLFVVSEPSQHFEHQFAIRAGSERGITLFVSPEGDSPTLREIRDAIVADLQHRLMIDTNTDEEPSCDLFNEEESVQVNEVSDLSDQTLFNLAKHMRDQLPMEYLPVMPETEQLEKSKEMVDARNAYLIALFQSPYVLQMAKELLLGVWMGDDGYNYERHLASSSQLKRTEKTMLKKMDEELLTLTARIDHHIVVMEECVKNKKMPSESSIEESLSLAEEMRQYPFFMKRINTWRDHLFALNARVQVVVETKKSLSRTRQLYGPTEDDELQIALDKFAAARICKGGDQAGIAMQSFNAERNDLSGRSPESVTSPNRRTTQRRDLINMRTMLGLRKKQRTDWKTSISFGVSPEKVKRLKLKLQHGETKLHILNTELSQRWKVEDPIEGLYLYDDSLKKDDATNDQLDKQIQFLTSHLSPDDLALSVQHTEAKEPSGAKTGRLKDIAESVMEKEVPEYGLLLAAGESANSLKQRTVQLAGLWKKYDDLRWELVMGNARFIITQTRRRAKRRTTRGVLLTEGTIGMLDGADRFEYGMGVKFLTFAGWYAKNGIQNAIDSESYAMPLTGSMREMVTATDHLIERMMHEWQISNPTSEQITDYSVSTNNRSDRKKKNLLHPEEEEVNQRKLDQINRYRIVKSHGSLCAPAGGDTETQKSDFLSANTPRPDEIFFAQLEGEEQEQHPPADTLNALFAIANLNDYQAKLIRMSSGAHPEYYGQEIPVRDLAAMLETSRQTISLSLLDAWAQIHNAVFLRMTHRDQLQDFLVGACLSQGQLDTLFGVHGISTDNPLLDAPQKQFTDFAHYIGPSGGEKGVHCNLYRTAMSQLKTGMMLDEFGRTALAAALKRTAINSEKLALFLNVHGMDAINPLESCNSTPLSHYTHLVTGNNRMNSVLNGLYEPAQMQLYTGIILGMHSRSEVIGAMEEVNLRDKERQVFPSFHGMDPDHPESDCQPVPLSAHVESMKTSENKIYGYHYSRAAEKIRRALGHGDTIFEK